MKSGITIETATSVNQILFMTEPYAAVGVILSDTGVTAGKDGKKIVKAGTPISGDLRKRDAANAFTVASGSDATGVLVHDVDVTAGSENATCLIFGFVDENKLESDVLAKWTEGIITALEGHVTLIK